MSLNTLAKLKGHLQEKNHSIVLNIIQEHLYFERSGLPYLTAMKRSSLDCTVKLWDFTKLAEEVSLEDVNVSHNPDIRTNTDTYLLRTYATKSSPLVLLHFSRRNVLLAVAMFDSSL